MTFSVLDATIADCPALATLGVVAFKDDILLQPLARNVPPDVYYAYLCRMSERRLQTSSLHGLHIFKAVDDETG